MFRFSHISYELNWKGNILIIVNQFRIVKSESKAGDRRSF